MKNQLLIKNFPKIFTENDIESFLFNFGAFNVRTFNPNSRMRYNAYATFIDETSTTYAMQNLHQLNLMGNFLIAVYAKECIQNSSEDILFENPKCEMEKNLNSFYSKLNHISPELNINFPISSLLKYKYPEATPFIIRNIAKALFNLPKFYYQVLHLMNKMNLPPPFINTDYEFDEILIPKSFDCQNLCLNSESSESEIESDILQIIPNKKEQNNLFNTKFNQNKRKLNNEFSKNSKKILICNPETNKIKHSKVLMDKIFENYHEFNKKSIKLKINEINKNQDDDLKNINTNEEFPKFSPKIVNEKLDEVQNENLIEFIKDEELDKNLIDKSEFCKYSVFKNYSIGEICTRLYIKNINKKVTNLDLKRIFGKFIDWSNEKEVKFFSIHLLKKGKLNGQAFISMPNTEVAKLAIEKTNGLIMYGKPIVVCFARSQFKDLNK